MRKIMDYDKARMHRALVNSGVPKDGLEDYVLRASNAEFYYTFEQQKEGLSNIDDLATDILKSKYLAPKETGPLQLWDRVARAMATVEETPESQEYWYDQFFGIMKDFKFVPGGRVMHGAGRVEVKRESTMSNCYVIPITWGYSYDRLEELDPAARNLIIDTVRSGVGYKEAIKALDQAGVDKETRKKVLFPGDSLEGIYQNLREAAEVYRTGGGVGTDLSVLRPKGAYVNATMDNSPGVTAFMNLLSESTETVAQQGRRGALMLTLRVSHPDVEDFITIKNDLKRSKVKHANISVLVDHEFMKAVANDKDYTLWWENEDLDSDRYGERIEKTVNARNLWRKMIESAHASAEPGIIFWETMKDFHNGEYAAPLTSTNPCGEQPLASYTACNLGNLNLLSFVKHNGSFDYKDLAISTRVATRFLDDVITYNHPNHALTKIQRAVADDRRTGLGITGLGDALAAMKIKYDSDKGLKVTEKIMRAIRDEAYKTSIDLAKERGAFPLFDWDGISQSKFIQSLPEDIQAGIKEYGLRNVTLLTVPPVGTGSIIAQTTSGVEPIFSTGYFREVKEGERDHTKRYRVVHPLIRRMFGEDKDLPEYVVTAHKIDPFFRVKIQGIIQKYNDTAISSTINLPEETSVDTVDTIYQAAYREGLKGVTVYREGSRKGILETEEHAKKDLEGIINIEKPDVINERARSATYSIRTGEGKLHVTITNNERSYPQEVFENLGPIGTSQSTSASVDGLRLTRYLQDSEEPDVLEILKDYGSAKSDKPLGFGPNRVDSIHHGFSIIWRYHLLKSGVIKQDGERGLKQVIFKNSNKKNEEQSSDFGEETSEDGNYKNQMCGECGSRNTRMVEGCKKPFCMDCGANKCS